MSSDAPPLLTRTGAKRVVPAAFGDVEGIERALWVLVAAALVGDLLTTYYGLQIGLTESNPVARAALEQFGFAAMFAMKLFAVGVGVFCRQFLAGRHVLLVPVGLAVPWTAAVVVNLSLYATVL
ncbi:MULTISPECIES: DUF5658 family protein [Halorussus]|uniref:DUF5658 family protein n=1 Tax=Halorussus TaxID=1070314 RepID=UPI00209E8135|nr:DUF5658 family protein [Halorussus vallis]USZ76257.1 DUF5658 family protein [Halorussus vallis]